MTGGTTTTDAGDPGERVAPDDGGSLFIPAVTGGARPDPRVLPASPTTRFAPAPIGGAAEVALRGPSDGLGEPL